VGRLLVNMRIFTSLFPGLKIQPPHA